MVRLTCDMMMRARFESASIDYQYGTDWAGRHEYRVAEALRLVRKREEDEQISVIASAARRDS